VTLILRKFLSACPFVAILRSVTPEQAPAIVETLAKAGFRIIEVPLNSPRPYDSIEVIARQFGKDLLVGAGRPMAWRNINTRNPVRNPSTWAGTIVVLNDRCPDRMADRP
jgi:hypothetical protein